MTQYTPEDWETARRERRRATMALPEELIARILQLPDGVRYRGMYADPQVDAVMILVEGPLLEPTAPGTYPIQLHAGWSYNEQTQTLRYMPWEPEGQPAEDVAA